MHPWQKGLWDNAVLPISTAAFVRLSTERMSSRAQSHYPPPFPRQLFLLRHKDPYYSLGVRKVWSRLLNDNKVISRQLGSNPYFITLLLGMNGWFIFWVTPVKRLGKFGMCVLCAFDTIYLMRTLLNDPMFGVC